MVLAVKEEIEMEAADIGVATGLVCHGDDCFGLR